MHTLFHVARRNKSIQQDVILILILQVEFPCQNNVFPINVVFFRPMGQVHRSNRILSPCFFHDAVDVRQVCSFFEIGDSISTDDTVDLFLGSLQDFGKHQQGKNDTFHDGTVLSEPAARRLIAVHLMASSSSGSKLRSLPLLPMFCCSKLET